MKAPLYDTAATDNSPRRRFAGTAEQMLIDIQAYADAGVSHIIFDIRGADLNQALERLEWFAQEILPHG